MQEREEKIQKDISELEAARAQLTAAVNSLKVSHQEAMHAIEQAQAKERFANEQKHKALSDQLDRVRADREAAAQRHNQAMADMQKKLALIASP